MDDMFKQFTTPVMNDLQQWVDSHNNCAHVATEHIDLALIYIDAATNKLAEGDTKTTKSAVCGAIWHLMSIIKLLQEADAEKEKEKEKTEEQEEPEHIISYEEFCKWFNFHPVIHWRDTLNHRAGKQIIEVYNENWNEAAKTAWSKLAAAFMRTEGYDPNTYFKKKSEEKEKNK